MRLINDMTATIQSKQQTVLDHGLSVWKYTQKILNKDLEKIKTPKWLEDNYDEIIDNLHDLDTVKLYNIFHDCGKPYCLQIDEDGRRHFPDHANVSKNTWLTVSSNQDAANLIGWDMVFHTETAEQIKGRKLSKKDLYTLLITALAEIHSNAEMFGGIDSVSFKSKWKKLDRRGKMVFRELV